MNQTKNTVTEMHATKQVGMQVKFTYNNFSKVSEMKKKKKTTGHMFIDQNYSSSGPVSKAGRKEFSVQNILLIFMVTYNTPHNLKYYLKNKQ